jgi:hypothetical protein
VQRLNIPCTTAILFRFHLFFFENGSLIDATHTLPQIWTDVYFSDFGVGELIPQLRVFSSLLPAAVPRCGGTIRQSGKHYNQNVVCLWYPVKLLMLFVTQKLFLGGFWLLVT